MLCMCVLGSSVLLGWYATYQATGPFNFFFGDGNKRGLKNAVYCHTDSDSRLLPGNKPPSWQFIARQ